MTVDQLSFQPGVERSTSSTVVMPSVLTTIVIAVGFAATAALGLVPGPVLDLAATAGQFVR